MKAFMQATAGWLKPGTKGPAPSRKRPGASMRILVEEADSLRDRGEYGRAAEAYRAALAQDPDRTDLAVQLGNMLKDSGQLAKAEAAYRAALQVAPGNADTHLQLGHALKIQGRRGAALDAYRTAASLDPSSTRATSELAAMGEVPQLRAAFEAQLQAGGTDALVCMSQALLAIREQMDAMLAALPDARASAAFPVQLYDAFRTLFDVPPPPAAAPAPRIVVVLPVDGTPAETLHTQLAAFQAQSWPSRALLAVGSGEDERAVIARAAAASPGIEWHAVRPGLPAPEAEMEAVRAASGDWLVLLAPGAVLHPHALGWVAASGGMGPAAAFIWDEETGRQRLGGIVRSNPVLRQAVDYDTLLEAGIYGGNVAVRHGALAALASAQQPAPGRSALLLHLCRCGGIGHIPLPLSWSPPPPSVPDGSAHAAAVAAHLSATGVPARVEGPGTLPGSVRIAWRAKPERLHVIIPTRDNADDVVAFVGTLRATAARSDELAVTIIDNGGRDPAMLRRLQDLAASGAAGLQQADVPFNWSQLNNGAARLAVEPILVFANDDMQMLTPGWDDRLRGLLQRPEVGAVGARLIYDDETIQHAGILLGWRGSVIHDGLYEPMDSPGPGGRLQLTRAVGAVTGAFLATRRDTFLEVGGFDEAGLPVAYNDVDFCLKVRALGRRVLWTPEVTLIHHESKTRGVDYADPARQARNDAERRVLEARWPGALLGDPGVNPAWHDATLPFRLLQAPSSARVQAHIVRCAAADPWAATPHV